MARVDRPAFALALIFSCSIVWSGVPALRHDWLWPLHRSDFLGWFQIAQSGWSPLGIGAPTEHIERYLLALPLTLCGLALGGRICLFAFLVAVGYALASSGALLARRFGRADGLVAAALGAFLLFNPWTYTEVVAGHIEMILAVAGIAGMLARLSSDAREGDELALAFCVVLAYSQLQFYLLALPLAAVAAALHRGRLPLLTALIVGTPTLLGVAGNFTALAQTPTSIPWQVDQSLDPGSAWRLLGYFAGYAAGFSWASWAFALVCLSALTGAYVARERAAARWFAFAVPVLLIAMTGLRGPLAPVYGALLRSFPPVGVYRELYDLGGLLAICYAALAAAGAAASRALRGLVVLASGALVATWLITGVTRWWVPAERLPRLDVAVGPGQRYALLPAFQPLSFGGLGDGVDPDALYRAGGIVPLNGDESRYPDGTALANFVYGGETRDLAALGVAAVYGRPWLQAAAPEVILPFQRPLRVRGSAALVALQPTPRIVAVPAAVGAGSAFFGDAAGLAGPGVPPAWRDLPRVRSIEPDRTEVDPALGWVDARLHFVDDPDLAQPFGGVFTTSQRPFVLKTAGRYALAYVRGKLLDDAGAVLNAPAAGYRWVLLPASREVRCAGACALALTGDPPASAGLVAAAPVRPVSAERRLAWLIVAHLPAGNGPRALRLNERYDSHWLALAGARFLPHLRLDGTVNAWLGAPVEAGDVVLFNALALAQALFELLGAIWVAALLVRAVVYSSP